MMKPRCCAPGIILLAIQPTMKPTMIDQMMCNIVLFWLGRRGYQVSEFESHSFLTRNRNLHARVILDSFRGAVAAATKPVLFDAG